MPNKAIAISDYAFRHKDRLLLDTNIWLLIYGPNRPNDSRVKVYSQAFNNMIKAKSQIYIDVLVTSEFINSYVRTHVGFKKRKNASIDFKAFRKSKSFEPIAKSAADMMKRVLKDCRRIESEFEILTINSIIDEYAKGKSDFNDQIIATICEKNNLKLVTDDGDFKDTGIFVLTANKKILN